ncbi:MAG: ABC transporter ATP-binding protein [Anaerolineales bacterium]|nr:ABC transporter ATP-binding protein [Anaerolineales bacterium]
MIETDAEAQAAESPFAETDLIITTDDLSKIFGMETAVDHLNLEVPRGATFGFIGPSGCGKTTTVRLLLGVYKPSSGTARVLGRDPQHFARREREKIGYMPQLFVLYPELTVWENLNFAASLYGVSWRRSERLHELLALVELTEHRNKLVEHISGGMRRRLSMAAALVHDPQLLFLDEPTAGIDPVLRRTFWDYFERLQEKGRTLFVTTQYVGEAAYCDYVGVMMNGRLLTVDTPTELRRRALGGDVVELETETYLAPALVEQLKDQQPAVKETSRPSDRTLHLVVDDASTAMPALLGWLQQQDIRIVSVTQFLPPFDDVFVRLIEQAQDDVA